MADSVAQVREVIRLLRGWGYEVVEISGWENRGKGDMTTRGRIEHHTAGGSGDTPSLRVVTFGRPGLRNSLSRYYISRSGVIYVIARKTSWHAGRGVKGSNSTLSGTEAEHSGSSSESWPDAVLSAAAAISAAEAKVFKVPSTRIFEHKEHAPRRKVDRISIIGNDWRHRVRQLIATGVPGPASDPLEDDMLQHGANNPKPAVVQAQHLLNRFLKESSEAVPGWFPLDGGGKEWAREHDGRTGSHLITDGDYGDKTRYFVEHAESRCQHILGHPIYGSGDGKILTAQTQAWIIECLQRLK